MATFKQRDSGYWQAKIRRKGFPPQSRTFSTKKDAVEWARLTESKIDCGDFKDTKSARNKTLQDALEHYRDSVVDKHKGKDIDLVRIKVFLKSELIHYSLAALDHHAIQSWVDARNKTCKGSTVNRYLNLLSSVISTYIRCFDLNIENPVSKVLRPTDPEHRNRRLEGEEEQRLLDALTVTERDAGKFTGPQNIWLKPIVQFALATGMRRSELLALEWQYVNMKQRFVHLPDTKIGKGKDAPVSREVPLSARALGILESLPRDIEGKVFPITSDSLKKGFERAVARARKSYLDDCKRNKETPLARMLVDLHFHDLRHEATSRLAKIYDVRQLALVGGWRNLNTLKRYYNPTTSELVEEMKKYEQHLAVV